MSILELDVQKSSLNITFSKNHSSKKYQGTFISIVPRLLFVSITMPFFTILLSVLIIFGTSSPVWAAQLDARINPDSPDFNFQVKYQRTIFIEYNEGGQLADQLRGTIESKRLTADSTNLAIVDLINRINQKLNSDGSGAIVSDLNVEYSAQLVGREINTSIDYKIILSGTITDHIIRERQGQAPAIIDVGWRGITVEGPVVIDDTEINLPISFIKDKVPSVFSSIKGTEAEVLLSENLINAEGIKNQPLPKWHFLFDPTGINVDAATFGLAEEITGFVVSGFTMGESSLREGRQVEKIVEAQFTLDKSYIVRSVESADSANIAVIGFGVRDSLEGLEIFGVTPTAPEGFATTSTGEFPVSVIYGMAAMAAIGGVGIFIYSNRKLKREGTEQTGIDPSQLKAYKTSAGAGGYQTIRGEAQLIDDSDYQKTRSVYDEEKPQESTKSQSTKGTLPKGWKPE
ncbi:MAG: hypothetical protein NPMRTHETA2_490020 [Nitrosopumilales archaeon]|nr:MAG: hypothetical protein NPMRTHETA2_490020 [Nitrosopumilales archaeon]